MSIEGIFVACDKNAAMEPRRSASVAAGIGIEGDRYALAKNRNNEGRQVTFIEAEQIERFVAETGLSMAVHEPRRNIVTRGVDLNALVGRRFTVGDCEFEGVELCEPCAKWARSTHPGVVRFFVHRGGLNARVVRGGTIRVGDAVSVGA